MAESDSAAAEARNTALEAFDSAADVEDVVERAQKEQEAAVSFAEEIAAALNNGLSKPHARSAAGQISEVSKHYTKQDLTNLIEEKQETLSEEDDGRRPFDDLLVEELDEVAIVRTTDAKQSTIYRWQFNGASVETTASGESRTHFSWSDFRNEFFDAVGEDPGKPSKERRGGEEWREFIVDIVDNRGREVTTRGPRSAAVDGLKNFIRRSRAYATIDAMVERDGLRLDAPPSDQPSEIWVPNAAIKRVCDEYELENVRELQLELDARGLTVDRVNGVSESTTVNNDKVTYWVLDATIASPSEYIEEPVDPAEQVREEESDESDGTDDSGGFGAVGTVGDDPDDGGDANE